MLELPPGWQSCSTGYVVKELLRQADAIGQYSEAARAMTRGSLEFMLSGPRWAGRLERSCVMPHPRGWRINDWLFYVLPRAGADVVMELKEVLRFRCHVDLIVPPWAECLVRHAVGAALPRFHVDVYSIANYVDLRMFWTSLDMNRGYAEALIDLLQRYTRLVQKMPNISIQPFA